MTEKVLSSDIAAKIRLAESVDTHCLLRWQTDAKHLEELVDKLSVIVEYKILGRTPPTDDHETMETELANPDLLADLLRQCAIRTGKAAG